jgi:hypothetical protein
MDSVTGRFLSPDPFVQFPFDSQSFNRYSYVRNNPLSATDPSGFQEYDGDVRSSPLDDWEPPMCWHLRACGSGWNLFPRNYVVVRRPEPKIPPSRATPEAVPGPAVIETVDKTPWNELSWWDRNVLYAMAGFDEAKYDARTPEQVNEAFRDFSKRLVDSMNSSTLQTPGGGQMMRASNNVVSNVISKAAVKTAANAAVKSVAHNHHPIAKFLGGNVKQLLSNVDSNTHREFHSTLAGKLKAAGIPLNVGGVGGSAADWSRYMNANPGSQRKAFDAVLETARELDAKNGTGLTQDVWYNVMKGNFTPYP